MYPLVSVIVPVFNVEDYLRTCIDCLLNQTYPNVEIILVDDGSQDSSGEICDLYAANFVHVRAIHKENGGLSDARNTGFANSHGEYIAFLDSDDWASPDTYQELVELMLENEAQVACANYYVHQQGTPVKTNKSVDDGVLVMTGEEALEIVLSFGVIGNSIN